MSISEFPNQPNNMLGYLFPHGNQSITLADPAVPVIGALNSRNNTIKSSQK